MAISTETVKQLQFAGIKADRIKLVFESIDFTEILESSRAALEAPLPGINGSPRILLPATLLRTKGQHTAIKSVSHLKKQGYNPTLWLAGDTTPTNELYVRYLHELVEELEVSENVYFLGWRHDVPAIIVQSDVVILPTHTEGFGRVALEAMLLRRPAVTTPVGGMKDLIQDGQNGLFFPVEDDETLARHLARLATDSQFVAELIENGYKKATEEFNPELHTQRVHKALASAAESVNT
jgi:glycosyltransferase involved in cell wall biosynthesis